MSYFWKSAGQFGYQLGYNDNVQLSFIKNYCYRRYQFHFKPHDGELSMTYEYFRNFTSIFIKMENY